MLEINKIHNMDALEGLKQIEDNSIDLIITDPPYGMNKEFEIDIDINYLIKSFALLSYKKLKDNSWIIFTCSIKNLDFWIDSFKYAKFKYERLFTYYKKGKFTDVWIGWLLKSEAILLFSKGKPNKSNYNKEKYHHDVYIVKSYNSDNHNFINHQSAKSEFVWRHLIQTLSKEEYLVIDPFMGSGTTAVVCKQLNRNFIGFEISQEYCNIANKRLEQDNILNWLK